MGGAQDYVEGLPGFVAETVLSAGSSEKNSLQGIDVSGLVDGALCYVRELFATYRYFDDSASPAVYPYVVAPAVGNGRWVLMGTDALIPGRAHIQTTLSAPQAVADLAAGADLILDTVAVNGGVTYNPVTGLYTLQEYATYELEFYGFWSAFNDAATDYAAFEWCDNADDSALVAGTNGVALPMDSTLAGHLSSQTTAKCIVTVPAGGLVVKVRAQGGSGAASLTDSGSYAIVRRIG